MIPNLAMVSRCHFEERSDEAIAAPRDCFDIAFNARTGHLFPYALAKCVITCR
ncbi:MAG: hypothetical protein JRI41_03480 [Deltaproteobacteria bacterium]|nr:hypothetical protein [Deltaproteobacteria bacterium]